jgi:hypothetical protein
MFADHFPKITLKRLEQVHFGDDDLEEKQDEKKQEDSVEHYICSLQRVV